MLIRQYSEKTGLEALNLSLGNPDGVPPEAIRALKARFARDSGYEYHTYAEDKNLHRFAEGMVELHGRIRMAEHPHLRAVPIAGIKTATAMIPLACGLGRGGRRERFKLASPLPAYDIIGTWTGGYLGAERIVWPMLSSEGMALRLERLKEALKKSRTRRADLIFLVRPGNPAAVGASRGEWQRLIEYCISRNTRLVNDAAYAGLAGNSHVPLAEVAAGYPKLEWMELYSVSKSFNDPGARLGALVGSKEFVEDFLVIKGNTDSGPVPSVMAAYGEFLQDQAAARAALEGLRSLYQRRLDYLIPKLKQAGLRQACPTDAGFFTLWKTPQRAFGLRLGQEDATRGMPPHEAFNRAVIAETGIVGVHFQGPSGGRKPENFIRYAVCADVLDRRFQERFESALERLKPEYE